MTNLGNPGLNHYLVEARGISRTLLNLLIVVSVLSMLVVTVFSVRNDASRGWAYLCSTLSMSATVIPAYWLLGRASIGLAYAYLMLAATIFLAVSGRWMLVPLAYWSILIAAWTGAVRTLSHVQRSARLLVATVGTEARVETDVSLYRGVVLVRVLGDRAESVASLRRAISMKGGDSTLWGLAGVCLEKSSLHSEALQAFDRVTAPVLNRTLAGWVNACRKRAEKYAAREAARQTARDSRVTAQSISARKPGAPPPVRAVEVTTPATAGVTPSAAETAPTSATAPAARATTPHTDALNEAFLPMGSLARSQRAPESPCAPVAQKPAAPAGQAPPAAIDRKADVSPEQKAMLPPEQKPPAAPDPKPSPPPELKSPAPAEKEPPAQAPEIAAGSPARFKIHAGPGLCDVCNRPVGPGEAYLVPVDAFYSSPKYREWLEQSGLATLVGGVEAFIAQARSLDSTSHSAVCDKCIHMFL